MDQIDPIAELRLRARQARANIGAQEPNPAFAVYKPDPATQEHLLEMLRRAPTSMPAPPPQQPGWAEAIKGWPGNVNIDPYIQGLPEAIAQRLRSWGEAENQRMASQAQPPVSQNAMVPQGPSGPLRDEYLRQAESMDPATRATFLRDVGMLSKGDEHAAFAQALTQQYGPLGALSMAAAAPAYAAAKGIAQALPGSLGLPYQGSSRPTLEEVTSAYRGIWRGLTAPTNDQPVGPLKIPVR